MRNGAERCGIARNEAEWRNSADGKEMVNVISREEKCKRY